jgi:uncharacterized membrane protein YhfC
MSAYWAAFAVMFGLVVVGPGVAAVWLRSRLGVPLRVFEVAAGFYLLNLVVQVPVFRALAGAGVRGGLAFTALLAPAVYALCEETLRYLSFRATRAMRANRTPDGALMAGLGHGGMEAALFALSLGWTLALATFAPEALGSAGVGLSLTPGDFGAFFAVFTVSRLSAIASHLGFAVLVVAAYRRSLLFLPAAIGAHFAVDASTFGLQAIGAGSWWLLVFAVWAAAGGLLVAWSRRGRERERERAAAAQPG